MENKIIVNKESDEIVKNRFILKMIVEDYKKRIRFIEKHTEGDAYTVKQYQQFINCLEEVQNTL